MNGNIDDPRVSHGICRWCLEDALKEIPCCNVDKPEPEQPVEALWVDLGGES